MGVCVTFSFFGMLCQSNLALATATQFNRSMYTCRGDGIQTPQAFLSSPAGPKHTTKWPHHQFHPSQWYPAPLQIQWMHIINSSPHLCLLLIAPPFLPGQDQTGHSHYSHAGFCPSHRGEGSESGSSLVFSQLSAQWRSHGSLPPRSSPGAHKASWPLVI